MISVIFYVLSNFDRLPYKSPYIHKCVNQILIPCQQVLILIILTYSEKPLGFFLRTAPNPTFCVPSQFVSWSAHPLEPPSETYVSALHDIWSTKARKLSMALSVNWTLFVANSFVQLVIHSCLKSVKPFHDMPDKNFFAVESIQAVESNPILCFTADVLML